MHCIENDSIQVYNIKNGYGGITVDEKSQNENSKDIKTKNFRKENKKKNVEEITSRDKDFAKWYTDVVRKAHLMDYSSVHGCMIIEPYGYAIWENIKKILDRKFKELGHENVMMPMLIPESLLQKEKDHIEGFAPEVAWVTHGGSEKLQERLCVRPTSETLFCEYFSRIVQSWRDLPKLYNQWCSVVRWEKTTRPFLRSSEFLWQEGHTLHENKVEAEYETRRMLNVYIDLFKEYLAIPVLVGKKTESEKFAGAEYTFTVETMMHDGRALQSATSHYFGNGFAKAFNIKYQARNNQVEYPFQTSWGLSTRVIGAVIMVHGDDDGLVLPPDIAPIQVIIIPINMSNTDVAQKVQNVRKTLDEKYRVQIDFSDQTPGWKFAEYEMKGVPLRIEIGPKDVKKNQCVIVRRDTGEKVSQSLEDIDISVALYLEKVKNNLYNRALDRMKDMTYNVSDMEDFIQKSKLPGFIQAMWCGDPECEKNIKDKTGFTSRCIPLNRHKRVGENCIFCGRRARKIVYWAKSY